MNKEDILKALERDGDMSEEQLSKLAPISANRLHRLLYELVFDGLVSFDGEKYRNITKDPLCLGKVVTKKHSFVYLKLLREPCKVDVRLTGREADQMIVGDLAYLHVDFDRFGPRAARFVCPLQRVKGQLLILTEGLPAGINWSRKAVTGLSGEATYDGSYTDGEVETVVTTRSWGTDVTNPRSETVLAPTADGHSSTLYVRFYDHEDMQAPTADGHSSTLYVRFYDHEDMQTPAIEPDALNGVDMQRNRITPVKYVFDNGKVYIYTLVDDSWKLTHGMGIE